MYCTHWIPKVQTCFFSRSSNASTQTHTPCAEKSNQYLCCNENFLFEKFVWLFESTRTLHLFGSENLCSGKRGHDKANITESLNGIGLERGNACVHFIYMQYTEHVHERIVHHCRKTNMKIIKRKYTRSGTSNGLGGSWTAMKRIVLDVHFGWRANTLPIKLNKLIDLYLVRTRSSRQHAATKRWKWVRERWLQKYRQ